jgi:hypothetical protein
VNHHDEVRERVGLPSHVDQKLTMLEERARALRAAAKDVEERWHEARIRATRLEAEEAEARRPAVPPTRRVIVHERTRPSDPVAAAQRAEQLAATGEAPAPTPERRITVVDDIAAHERFVADVAMRAGRARAERDRLTLLREAAQARWNAAARLLTACRRHVGLDGGRF